MLNPTDILTVTSFVTVLKPTVLIPTPLLLFIGRIVGVELLIPPVLLKIVTLESPREYPILKSFICSPVFPSNTIKSGAYEYPLPIEVILILPILAYESTFIICGKEALGFKVLSVGKSYPISLSLTFSIVPILLLTETNSALVPSTELTDSISGRLS